MSVIDRIKEKAKTELKHIVLAEGSEPRTVQASAKIVAPDPKPATPAAPTAVLQKDGTILVARTKGTPVEDNPKKKVWTGSVVTATFDAEKKAIVVTKP